MPLPRLLHFECWQNCTDSFNTLKTHRYREVCPSATYLPKKNIYKIWYGGHKVFPSRVARGVNQGKRVSLVFSMPFLLARWNGSATGLFRERLSRDRKRWEVGKREKFRGAERAG